MDVIGVVLASLFLTLNRSMDWFLYDNGLRHERVKIAEVKKTVWFRSNKFKNIIFEITKIF